MARAPLTFRKSDVVRLIEGAKAAGMIPQQIWVEDGKNGRKLELSVATREDHEQEAVAEVDTWEDVE